MLFCLTWEIEMNTVFRVLMVFGLCFLCSPLRADVVGDIFRQGGAVVVDSERNKVATSTDGERKKTAIEADAVRQINHFASLIAVNDRRITEELELELDDVRSDMRILERDRASGMISRSEYTNEKRRYENRIVTIRNSITALRRQNLEYARRQSEIRLNADNAKKQVDIDVRSSTEHVEKNRNTNIIERLIRELGR